ncbi:MAG TPA: ABC transporter permease [Rudaea sp.]|nr:ABC transporter permease [Rudaea sp.]
MFNYYLQLGLISLRRNPVLTALMVLGIALGIAATMTSLTLLHVMGGDPIPWKSDKLHYVQLDNWDPNQPYDQEGNPPDQVSYRDAQALMEAGKADKQAAMFKVAYPIQPENPEVKPFLALGRATYGDFFAMFEPPFQYGGGWDHAQDAQHGRVVVLSKESNEKLFGGQDSVGKKVRMNEIDYTIVGVLDYWKPRIKYYDLTNGTLNDPEEFYVPYTTVIENKSNASGNNSCWRNSEPGWEGYLASECIWQQFWVQLDSPARVAEYKSFQENYVNEQKKLGRFPRPMNNRLYNVTEWLENQKVVPKDVEVQVGLSFAFLLVCLVNTIGLLLAKFMRKTGEIGLRRALGASKPQLFSQYIIESGVIGVSGGVFGLLLTLVGLWMVRLLYESYANVARLDWAMIATTIALAIVAAVLAGLYPTWRACQVAPAAQLKTQ